MTEEILQQRDDRVLTRLGEAVRHPWHPWSPATRALLKHLSAVGFALSPRVIGTDGQADLLSYIPGVSGADGWAPAVTEEGLAAAARLLRSYHDVPFRDDAECLRWLCYPDPPDRHRRISIFAEAYGLGSADGLVDRVIAIQTGMRDLVARLAKEGFPRQVNLVAAGNLDELQAWIDWSWEHRHLIEP
jgi:Phosphotransferase enzyme family